MPCIKLTDSSNKRPYRSPYPTITPIPESTPPSANITFRTRSSHNYTDSASGRGSKSGNTNVASSALPIPTYVPVDPTKKSHAKKQPAGHIPRPRNAFILFRCDFVRQKKIPEDVENDHRNISRIVGKIWREMTDEDKGPWVKMAEKEKEIHCLRYPNYRYAPSAKDEEEDPGAAGAAALTARELASPASSGSESRRQKPLDRRFEQIEKGDHLPHVNPVENIIGNGGGGVGGVGGGGAWCGNSGNAMFGGIEHMRSRGLDEFANWSATTIDFPSKTPALPILPHFPFLPISPTTAASYSQHFPHSTQMFPSSMMTPEHFSNDMYRPSSCPPPDSVPIATWETLGVTPLMTRDDLARRPSRVIMYHSNSPTSLNFPQPAYIPYPGNAPTGRASMSHALNANGQSAPRADQEAAFANQMSSVPFTFPWARGLHLGVPMSFGGYNVHPGAPLWDDGQTWNEFSNFSANSIALVSALLYIYFIHMVSFGFRLELARELLGILFFFAYRIAYPGTW